MVTGAGAPGIKGTIYSLKNNYDKRKIKLIGTDIKDDVIGKYFVESFYKIPKPSEKEFINRILDICEKENVNFILPQVTDELEVFSKNKEKFEKNGVKVAVSDYENFKIANNKFLLTKIAQEIGAGAAKLTLVKSMEELEEVLPFFGYPKKPVVIKPPSSRGMRGLRIIDETKNRYDFFMEEKPTSVFITKNELNNIFVEKFPELLISEYMPGEEYSVDILADNGNPLVIIPRKRLEIRSGITFKGVTEKHEKIIEYSKLLTEKLRLNYAFGFQFKLDEKNEPKLLECNPRIQGTMVMATLSGANIIYSSLKLLLGEKIPKFDIKWNMKFIRYWGGISVFNDKFSEEI